MNKSRLTNTSSRRNKKSFSDQLSLFTGLDCIDGSGWLQQRLPGRCCAYCGSPSVDLWRVPSTFDDVCAVCLDRVQL